jgi:plastocyanin
MLDENPTRRRAMTITTPPQPSLPTDRKARPGTEHWTLVLGAATATVVLVDLLFFAVIRVVIPPLAVGALLTTVGIGLLRSRRRTGIAVLGLTSLVMLAGSLAGGMFVHFGHPESGVDWAHSLVGSSGRVVAIAAAIAAWRGASERSARRTGVISLGALGLVAVIALVATVATSGEAAEPGDVVAIVERAEFPDGLTVDAGNVLHVDNRDLVRQTFTVEGTDIDVQLPARQGVRVPIDLTSGTYELVCEIPGHEAMTGTLEVR